MKKILTILFVCLLGCTSTNNPIINPNGPIDPSSTDGCAPSCKHLRDLNCDIGFPFDKNNMRCQNELDTSCTTCETFCENTIKNNVWLNTDCVVLISKVTAPLCPEIEVCSPK